VFMPLIPWTHLERNRDIPLNSSLMETAGAMSRTIVRYDNRGSGLSDREAPDYSLDGHVRDLEAVADATGLEGFALVAQVHAGPVAVAYAVRHPERVSHLVLSASHANGAEYVDTPQFQALLAIMDKDWDLFTNTAARAAFGFSNEVLSRAYAEMFWEATTAEVARKIYDEIGNVDVSGILGEVRAPTLVIRVATAANQPVERARELASSIPGAKLVTASDFPELPALIRSFIGDGPSKTQSSASTDAAIVHTILFTDVVGSTAMTQRLGDAKARELLREHERITREALEAHGGSEVKAMGDGFMASFASAAKALECSIAIQRAFAERNESAEEAVNVRIGLNAGEPIAEDDPSGRGDLFGTAVNMAARIAATADGEEILASNVVRELVAGKKFMFNDRGEKELRGFEDPVRVYEVRWRE